MNKFHIAILAFVLVLSSVFGPTASTLTGTRVELAYASEGGGGSGGGGGTSGGSTGGGGGGGGSHRGHNTQVILSLIDFLFGAHYAGKTQPGTPGYTFTTTDREFLCSIKNTFKKTTSAGKDYALTYLAKKMSMDEAIIRAFFRNPKNCK